MYPTTLREVATLMSNDFAATCRSSRSDCIVNEPTPAPFFFSRERAQWELGATKTTTVERVIKAVALLSGNASASNAAHPGSIPAGGASSFSMMWELRRRMPNNVNYVNQ